MQGWRGRALLNANRPNIVANSTTYTIKPVQLGQMPIRHSLR